MTKLKKLIIPIVMFAILTLVVWIWAGIHVQWGPFSFLAFDRHEKAILQKYDATQRPGEIVFYGASNFRLWKEMDEDMLPYCVQNHGFGGATDKELIKRAETLLYPYEPSVVVFQTGSNDYADFSGTDDEIVAKVIENKKAMFDIFHTQLPDAYFVVVSGILMPERSQYDSIVNKVNQYLREYCAENTYMYFVDAEEMTVDSNGKHKRNLFISDGIHLTHEARLLWAEEYIKPILKQIIEEHSELDCCIQE